MSERSEHTGPLGDMFDGFEIDPSAAAWEGVEDRLKAAPLASVFGDFVMAPSTQVWRGIEAVLQPGRRRRIAAWWWSAAGIAVLVVSGLLSVPQDELALAFKHSIGPELDRAAIGLVEQGTNVEGDDQAIGGTQENGAEGADPKNSSNSSDRHLAQDNTEPQKLVTPEFSIPNKSASAGFADMAKVDFRMTGLLATKLPERQIIRPTFIQFIDPPVLESDETNFALLAGLSPGLATSASVAADNGTDPTTLETFIPTDFLSLDSKIDEADYYDYRPPLTIGAMAKYPLGKRWSLLSGVEYTLISGKREETFGNYLNRQSTRQNYLALPLMVSFKLTRWDRGELSLSTGPVYAFGLREVVSVKSYDGAELLNDYSYSNSLSGLGGWRVSAGGAVQFSERIAVYAQAEFSSYLLQRTGSYWSSRSIWPGLNAGIRVGF